MTGLTMTPRVRNGNQVLQSKAVIRESRKGRAGPGEIPPLPIAEIS